MNAAETAGNRINRAEFAACIAADTVVFVNLNNPAQFAFAEITLIFRSVFTAAALRRTESHYVHSSHLSTPELEMGNKNLIRKILVYAVHKSDSRTNIKTLYISLRAELHRLNWSNT